MRNLPEMADEGAVKSAGTGRESGCVVRFGTLSGARGEYGGDFDLTCIPHDSGSDHASRLFHCAL